ncbi:hypothetical protein J6590_037186 [Homalodisca vitripennis]|nr:hypothetical protein J6590_037186 [Homalodisca vitripennis]
MKDLCRVVGESEPWLPLSGSRCNSGGAGKYVLGWGRSVVRYQNQLLINKDDGVVLFRHSCGVVNDDSGEYKQKYAKMPSLPFPPQFK